jgi:arabinan endo-1,5-alpha-L-arabinosidase
MRRFTILLFSAIIIGLIFRIDAVDSRALPMMTETLAPTESATQTSPALTPILPLTGVTSPVHDPTLIKDGSLYYIVSTGAGIPIHCSPDMLTWDNCGKVFRVYPAWVYKTIPGVTDLWAPDLVFWGGKYHLYYAASSFGSNHSAIGLATNLTLNQDSPDYNWADEGEVISSQTTDDFNAIDPNLITDQNGQRWLAFGSFWTGIKMRKIDSVTGKLAADDTTLYSLARRPGNGPIEGAFVTFANDYYYLFVSFDFCCKGIDSTYKIMVGRSRQVTGPYVDRDDKPMMNGGGTLVYAGTARWRGPGHNSIYIENGVYWMVYHAYDAQMNGTPTLQIEAIQWDNDKWPVLSNTAVRDRR